MEFWKTAKKEELHSDEVSSQQDFSFYKRVLFNAEEPILFLDPNFSIVFANAKAQQILERKILGGLSFWSIVFGSDIPDLSLKVLPDLEKHGEYKGEALAHRFSTQPIPIKMRLIKEFDQKGNTLQYIVYFSDISKSKKLQKELEYLSDYDPLTKFPNRVLFLKKLKKRLESYEGSKEKILIFSAEFDNLKLINEAYGHTVGDALLKAMSARILSLVPKKNHAARVGGNEFAFMIEAVADIESHVFIAKKIIEVLNESILVGTHEFNINVSLGLSVFPDDGVDSEFLLKSASGACYHAKSKGRNCWLRYSEAMSSEITRKHQLEQDLRKAIQDNAFEVYYQPKISVKTATITGVEALLRWKHADHGFVHPGDFISLAEETGLIAPLGEWILKKACHQVKEWQKLLPISIAVNLSAYQFKAQDMAEVVADVLWETGLDPQALQLELTESVVLENSGKSVMALRVLKAMGVSVAIDDFGTGYASLAYIRNFPVDCVKIDQSFIRSMLQNSEDAAIVKAIIELAHHLHFSVVAEGVETKAQLEYLIKESVDEIQGFYFSKPLPAVELLPLLEAAAKGTRLF